MPHFSVRELCRSLGVNRQWYYQHRCLSAHQEDDQRLRAAIQEVREAEALYGYRRVTKALVRAGWKVNHKRVWRIMRQANLTCRRKRRIVHTTDSRHSYQVYPNLVKGLQVEAPNRFWVADLTYVRLPEGFVYLACLLDVFSRTCIGWSLSRRIDAQLPLQAAFDGIGSTTSPSRVDPSRLFGEDSTVAMCMWSACSMSEPAKVMSTPGQPTENAFARSLL
jgi:putative transposase